MNETLLADLSPEQIAQIAAAGVISDLEESGYLEGKAQKEGSNSDIIEIRVLLHTKRELSRKIMELIADG